ncbi:MAG TPA: hypothetical protein PK644_06145, partial [bacterium]|nr:hypothetical protein [bacterium]
MDHLEFISHYVEYFRLLEKKRSQQELFLLTAAAVVFFLTLTVSLHFLLLAQPVLLLIARIFLAMVLIAFSLRLFQQSRWWARQNHQDLALRLEKKLRTLRNYLINACQLSRSNRYPACLVQRQREIAVEVLKQHRLEEAIDRKRTGSYRRTLMIAAGIFILVAALKPGYFLSGLRTFFLPSFAWDFSILVEPGDCFVEPGTEVTIRVTWPEKETAPRLEIKNDQKFSQPMVRDGSRYSYLLGPVHQPLRYRITGKNRKTRWFQVQLREKVGLSKMKVVHEYPAYTGLKRKIEEGPLAAISTLYNTRLTLQVYFTGPVGDAWLVLGSGKIFVSRGRSTTKIFTFTATEATLFEFRYYDPALKQTLTSSRERLSVSFDQLPFVTFTRPARDLVARLPAAVPVEVSASDDYGLKTITLRYHRGEGEISPADPVFFRAELQGARSSTFQAVLKLPDTGRDRVAYYAECTDNCLPVPNLGRSSLYFIYPPAAAPASLKQETNPRRQQLEEKVDLAKQQLEKFMEEQKKIVEAAKKFGTIRTESQKAELSQLAEQEQKWLEIFQKMVDDLNKL